MPKRQVSSVSCTGPCPGSSRLAMPGFWWCEGCWTGVPGNLRDWYVRGRLDNDGAACLKAKAVIDEHLVVLQDVELNP